MPQKRNTERVVVVRTDADGNVIDYDVVNQTIRSNVVTKRPSQVSRSQKNEQSPRISRTQANDNEEEYNDDDEEYEDIPATYGTPKKTSRHSAARSVTTPRRVRYVRPKSTVKIFEEKVEWTVDPRIDTHNDEAMKKIRNEPSKKLLSQKLSWDAKSKVDSHNEQAVETINRIPKSQIFTEKPNWHADPKVDSHNEYAIDTVNRIPKYRVRDEEINWNNVGPKVDSHNEEAAYYLKTAPKQSIYDEKLIWSTAPTMDTQNREYIQHKQRDRALREETAKTRLQSFPLQRSGREDKPRIDDYNAEFIEHKKRVKSSKLPPIEDRKLEWDKRSRINQRNDAYIERIRQKRSVPLIFQEKVKWKTKTPRIDNHNEEYRETLKEQKRPKIFSQLPQWKPQPRIDTYNDAYTQNSDSYLKPVIVNEKLRWHARSKIDTGLEPDPDEEEYVDDGLTS